MRPVVSPVKTLTQTNGQPVTIRRSDIVRAEPCEDGTILYCENGPSIKVTTVHDVIAEWLNPSGDRA